MYHNDGGYVFLGGIYGNSNEGGDCGGSVQADSPYYPVFISLLAEGTSGRGAYYNEY